MRRKRSTSCRKTTESCSPTSFPALACWVVWLLTTVSPCSQGYIHIEFVLLWCHWMLCVILAVGDQKLCWCFPCWHRSCDPILQPAGGPGDTAARSTPEDPAAPHGLIWPWISRPQSSGRPLWGHPLADTGVRSGAGHKSIFVCVLFLLKGHFGVSGFGTQESGVSRYTSRSFLGGHCLAADVAFAFYCF